MLRLLPKARTTTSFELGLQLHKKYGLGPLRQFLHQIMPMWTWPLLQQAWHGRYPRSLGGSTPLSGDEHRKFISYIKLPKAWLPNPNQRMAIPRLQTRSKPRREVRGSPRTAGSRPGTDTFEPRYRYLPHHRSGCPRKPAGGCDRGGSTRFSMFTATRNSPVMRYFGKTISLSTCRGGAAQDSLQGKKHG